MVSTRLINTGDFCTVKTDKFAAKEKIKRGDVVFIAGSQMFPLTKDTYTQRVKFITTTVNEARNEHFLMDPRSLKLITNEQDIEKYRDMISERLSATVN